MRMHACSLLAVLALAGPAAAETRSIQASPAAGVSQTVGITDVEIKYHRPAVKGREIWGKLVPFGQVWRAGANEATTLTVSTAVKLGGHPLPAGTYGLFVLPARDKWTVIVSKNAKQWGAYSYKQPEDALRVDVTPQAAPMHEWLSWSLDLAAANRVDVTLAWDKLKASFPLEVDTDGVYHGYLDSELRKADAASDAKQRIDTYLTAVQYWTEHGSQLDEATRRLDQADKLRAQASYPEFWILDVRAHLLAKQGKKRDALAALDQAKHAAAGHAPKEYLEELDQTRAEWAKK